MGKLWLSLFLFASPLLAMEAPCGWQSGDNPLISNARCLQKEARNHLDATESLLNISAIGEQLVMAAEITDTALSTVNRVGDIVLEMKQLVMAAYSDTMDAINRGILNTTCKSYLGDIQRLLGQTEYENHQIYSVAALDFTFNIMDSLKHIPLYSLQITSIYPQLVPLQSLDLTGMAVVPMAIDTVEQAVLTIAFEKQKLANSKKTIMELLKENSEKHEQAQRKLQHQIAILQDYLNTTKKLAPGEDK